MEEKFKENFAILKEKKQLFIFTDEKYEKYVQLILFFWKIILGNHPNLSEALCGMPTEERKGKERNSGQAHHFQKL